MKAIAAMKKQNMEKPVKSSKRTAPTTTVSISGDSARAQVFNDHDLSALPTAALPFVDGVYKGKHSYTVNIDQAVP